MKVSWSAQARSLIHKSGVINWKLEIAGVENDVADPESVVVDPTSEVVDPRFAAKR